MRNNNQFSISGKGYYIALILCAAAIGISGYLYHRNLNQAEEVSVTEAAEVAVPADTGQAEDVEVWASDPTRESTKPLSPVTPTGPTAGTKTPSQPTGTEAPAPQSGLKTAAPVDGQQVYGYSMDCLSYNETTRDWRVHNGVDFAAPEGTAVCAAADGTVYTTYEDDALGSTVVIRHTGGYTTRYSSLDKELSVKPGDKVTLGQPIGQVGSTALVEATMGSHVHFSVSWQDSPMDPAEFLNLN